MIRAKNEDRVIGGKPLDQRADKEQDRRDPHHVPPPHRVGQGSGEECADEAADQQRTDREAESTFIQRERGGEALLGPVDRPAVVTEQQAANRRDRDDGRNERHVGAPLSGGGHAFCLSLARLGAISFRNPDLLTPSIHNGIEV